MKQVHKFNFLGNVITENRKSDIKIQKLHTERDTFPKLHKGTKNNEDSAGLLHTMTQLLIQ